MMNQKEKAFEEIQQVIDKNRTNPRYLVLMGDLYLEENQPDKAIQYYEQAKEIDRNYPALILSLVNYYEKTDNKASSQAELQQAITVLLSMLRPSCNSSLVTWAFYSNRSKI